MTEFVKNENDDAAYESFMKMLVQARTSGKWMAAVWEVRDGRISLKGRTTSKFDRGDFLSAVSHLAANCAEEESIKSSDAVELPAPLPRAMLDSSRAMPDVKVFSMDPAEDEKGEPEKDGAGGSEPVPAGFPTPTPPTQEAIGDKLKGLPQVNVYRYEYGVIVHAKDHLPVALPADVTEAQITEAVENYKAGMGATQ